MLLRTVARATVCVALVLMIPIEPSAIEAQAAKKPFKIGILTVPALGPPPQPGSPRRLPDQLRELGYVEGRDFSLEVRDAGGEYERLPELAMDLVRARPDIIFALGNKGAQAALGATKTIPIVLVSCDAFTVVTSLARHGRNVTGVTCMRMELTGKRLEILKEAVPNARRIVLLYNPVEGPEGLQFADAAAKHQKVTLVPVPVRSATDFEVALDSVRRERPDALFVNPDAVLLSRRQQIADFALKHRLPAIDPFSEFVDRGGLLSYGANSADLTRRAAELIDRIVKGAEPDDLPVEQATRFYLTINLKTAKALGLAIPQSLLLRADRVIE